MQSRISGVLAVLTALMLAVTGLSGNVAAQQAGHGHDHGAAPTAGARPSYKPAPPGPLPAIPYDGYPSPRPMQVVQAVYEFAARKPDVLQYMPCYCGCERSAGHRGNHDCFVKRRAADGRVLEWDSHGYGCAICIDVARDAMQMHNSGASPASIRAAIDSKYGARFPTSTPTPKPPAAAKK
jgi:hypothetical protein